MPRIMTPTHQRYSRVQADSCALSNGELQFCLARLHTHRRAEPAATQRYAERLLKLLRCGRRPAQLEPACGEAQPILRAPDEVGGLEHARKHHASPAVRCRDPHAPIRRRRSARRCRLCHSAPASDPAAGNTCGARSAACPVARSTRQAGRCRQCAGQVRLRCPRRNRTYSGRSNGSTQSLAPGRPRPGH